MPRLLARVERTLQYAISDQGLVLWRTRWLERTLVPLLLQAAEAHPPHPGLVHLHAARVALEGVDAMLWMQRMPAVQATLICVKAAREQAPEPAPAPQRGELIVALDLPEIPAGPAPAEPSAAPSAALQPAQQHAMGAPQATGKPLSALRCVDQESAGRLLEAGIESIADLLNLVPARHEIIAPWVSGSALEEGAAVAVNGNILAQWVRFADGGRREELALDVGDRVLRCTWIQGMPGDLERGKHICLVGELELGEDEALLFEAMRWRPDSQGVVRRPRYELDGVPDELIWPMMREALTRYGRHIQDPLPSLMLREYRLRTIGESLSELHLPTQGLRHGRTRPVFVEFLLQQLRAASSQENRLRGIAHPLHHEALARHQLQSRLSLSDAQEIVFDDIRRDLRRPTAMTRLLQGDVGSGKALIALFSALLVAESRTQVCYLGPDGISAEHRYLFAEPLLRAAGLVPQLISGRPSLAQVDAIRRGEAHAIFGTHELFEHFPDFKKLGLVIVEERAQFGVTDREALCQKGVNPDLLVVTAVPIPLSLTFTVFSDHDLSVLREPMRQCVSAQVRGPDDRAAVYASLQEQLDLGRQAYVVFPMRDGQDLLDLPRARQLAEAMAAEAFPSSRVALYHGAMSRDERFRVFSDFQGRRIDVLICTTTIEDAPEVENATAMMVDHADRYDLVRLHRLRGHVAQGRFPGVCDFVLTPQPSVEGRAVVELVSKEQDGFAIAEKDRQVRGDSALLGGRKDRMPEFRLGDASQDRALLLKARRAALGVLHRDPELRQRAHRGLLALLEGGGMGAESAETGKTKSGPKRSKNRRRRRRKKKGS